MLRFLLAGVALVIATGASAQTYRQDFDVRWNGLRVARLVLAVRDEEAAYALAGRAESTGMAAIFRSVRAEMSAQGSFDGDRPRPFAYSEDLDTGRRASTVTLSYRDGVPEIVARNPDGPPEPWDIDPADQSGTIDPLSALFSLVRPRAAEATCGWSEDVFDGRRRSRLMLGTAEPSADGISCPGLYERIAGFRPEELADRTDFPFRATFREGPDGLWVLTGIELQSLYGPVEISRISDW
ncbi:DUF3108 domain-containing protein [Rhodobacterales bacterium HKCCE3408]|nr:DUF3108 domain-containing protein [Rhodobacterales bacterium HKCCE3408]